MARFRKREVLEGVRWLGFDTPKRDVDWLKELSSGPSNVKSVEFVGDKLKLTTHMTESVAEPGDYIAFGDNKQPIVAPPNVFERMYEQIPEVDDERD